MSSPFPGMDPYIERPRIWTDFHDDLAGEIRAMLNTRLQPKYFASLTPFVTYDVIDISMSSPTQPFAVRLDVGVWDVAEASGGVAVAPIITAPISAVVPYEVPITLDRVEVRSVDDERLVTVIEILSPVNKPIGHPAHRDYLRKRRHLMRSTAHLMEIDLLRGGERPPLAQAVPPAPYYVLLSRSDHRPNVDLWPIQLADPLPVLPVPLLAPDPDVPLDLGAAVRSVYTRGAYATRINYTQPPPPPVDPAEVLWIDERLRAEGRR